MIWLDLAEATDWEFDEWDDNVALAIGLCDD
jgi:hypothetical protein